MSSAVFSSTTPTKPSLYSAPMYNLDPYASPSSAAHQRHLSACGSTTTPPAEPSASRRRLRSAAPSISSHSHHRRGTGSLNAVVHQQAPSGRAASFDLTPVGSPTKHTPPSLSGYYKGGGDDDSIMRDPSPLRLAQPRTTAADRGASAGSSTSSTSRVQYRESRLALAVSSSNDQLRFDDGGGDSSTEEGSRRGSLEDPAAAAFLPVQGKSFQQRQRELSNQSSSSASASAPERAPPAGLFSSSKSLGRAAGARERSNSRAKRPAASMMMGPDEDGMDDGEDDDDDAHGHPMPDFGGRMRLTSSRGAADGDDDCTGGGGGATPGRTVLKPLMFNHPHFSPAPAARAPSPDTRHTRALTEHDLNRPARALPSHGSASKLIADEDNIFLDSSTDGGRPRKTTGGGGSGGLFSASTPLGRSRSLVGNHVAAPATRAHHLSASGSAVQGSSAMANSKKAVSMDNLQVPADGGHAHDGSSAPPSAFGNHRTLARSRRTGVLSQSTRAVGSGHRRGASQEVSPPTVARPVGTTKSSSAQNLSTAGAAGGGLPQSTSLSQLTTSSSASHLATGKLKAEASVLNRSAPATYNRTPDERDALAFNDAKPLLAAFTAKQSLGKKFKPRDSAISMDGDGPLVDSPMHAGGPMLPPPVPHHRLPVPQFLPSRLSATQMPAAAADEMDLQELMTPAGEPSSMSGWPSAVGTGGGPSLSSSTSTTAFDFLGREAAEAMASAAALHHSTGSSGSKPMPDTPVKTKSFGGSLSKSLAAQHPHPLSLASIRAEGSSSGSSSPSAPAGAGASLPPLGSAASHHHSLNVLAQSHRPSDVKPPHLRPLMTAASPSLGSASPAPSRSLIPKRSMTFRPKPSSLQARLTATSPESQTGSSSPPSGAESPTFLRRVAQQGALSASPRPGALAGLPRPSADAPRMNSLLRRTSSGVASMSGSESESGVEMTPTRRGPDSITRSACFSPLVPLDLSSLDADDCMRAFRTPRRPRYDQGQLVADARQPSPGPGALARRPRRPVAVVGPARAPGGRVGRAAPAAALDAQSAVQVVGRLAPAAPPVVAPPAAGPARRGPV